MPSLLSFYAFKDGRVWFVRVPPGHGLHRVMARNEDLHNSTWSMVAFENLSPDAALLWLWSWSNPRCGIAGLYDTGRHGMTESKVTEANLDRVLVELAGAPEHFQVLYTDGVLFSVSRLRRWRSRTHQSAKGVVKDLQAVKVDHPLRVLWLEIYGSAAWLKSALTEARVSLTQGSGEPHENLDKQGDSLSLTRASREPQPRLRGRGRGQGNKDSQTTVDAGASDLAKKVSEACDILAAVTAWTVEPIAVENAAAMHPNVDLLQGARLAVTWAADPSWDMNSAGATLRSALRKLDGEDQAKPARKKGTSSKYDQKMEVVQA